MMNVFRPTTSPSTSPLTTCKRSSFFIRDILGAQPVKPNPASNPDVIAHDRIRHNLYRRHQHANHQHNRQHRLEICCDEQCPDISEVTENDRVAAKPIDDKDKIEDRQARKIGFIIDKDNGSMGSKITSSHRESSLSSSLPSPNKFISRFPPSTAVERSTSSMTARTCQLPPPATPTTFRSSSTSSSPMTSSVTTTVAREREGEKEPSKLAPVGTLGLMSHFGPARAGGQTRPPLASLPGVTLGFSMCPMTVNPFASYFGPLGGLRGAMPTASMGSFFSRACYPLESLEPGHMQREASYPLPIPLPVYIRTRSPPGSEAFGKPKKCRRSRTVFTELQLMGLERKFESQKYLSTPDRMDLAEALGLSQIQVKTWYQNRRMKWKKQVLLKGGTESPTKPKGRPKKGSFENPEEGAMSSNDQNSCDSVDVTNLMTSGCQPSSPVTRPYQEAPNSDDDDDDMVCDDEIKTDNRQAVCTVRKT